jgi:Flp pilus assembly protein TadD
MMALGQLYIAKGEPATAETYYRRGLSLDQYNVELRAGLAKSLRTQGDRAGAEAMLQEAIRIDPRNWGLYSDLGQLYLSWGKSSEAVAAYDKAFELVPDNASVLGNVGSAYYYLGEFRKAALAYERSLEFDPTASAYSNIATLWFYEGEFERARENYEKAAEMTPRDYRVWSNLADAESQIDGMQESAQSHYREAFGMADELLAINQTNNEALVVSAWCAANLGMDEQARERVEQALSIAPDDYNVSYVSATVYAVLGAQEELQSSVQRSIELGFPQQILLATPILEGKLGFLEDET